MIAERLETVAERCAMVIAVLCLHQPHPAGLGVAVVAGWGMSLAQDHGSWRLKLGQSMVKDGVTS